MRRILALIVLCSSVALTGLAPAVKATPAPAAAPAAPKVKALPLVVVFPFDVSSDLKPQTGAQAAQLFVTQMNNAGGVDAINAPPTKRSDYLQYAKKLNADYYVAGFMTPLGDGVSLLEQVVETIGGTMLFGQTAQIQSLQDAAAQAVTIRDGIVQRENSLAAPVAQTSTQSTPAPLPSNEANIGSFASKIFHHAGKGPTGPKIAIVKPRKGIFVVRMSGTLPGSRLTQATDDLYAALNQRFNAKMTAASNANVSKEANAICGVHRDNTIATGTVTTKSVRHGIFSRTQYEVGLTVYTCFGPKLSESAGSGTSLRGAVSAAVNAYAEQHPNNF